MNQNGRLPVGVTVWYPDVFCVSGHDTYVYRMSFMYMHVGGRTWIVNVPGGAWSPGNTAIVIVKEAIVNNCTKVSC